MTYTRVRRELEPQWVSWFCAKRWPKAIIKFRCPLGPIPEEVKKAHGETAALKIYRPWRPEVDALIIEPGAVTLVEAKIQKFMDGLSKLPIYKSLIPTTPELKEWKHLPVLMVLLIPEKVDWVLAAAQQQDVQVITEAPQFILDVWKERDKYWTKEAVEERERRKQKLQELGYG